MTNNHLEKIVKLLKWGMICGAVAYIIAYLFVVFSRITYPFELIWLEGAYVDHVNRVLSGLKYYVEPSIEFVPSIYTPLFFYFSALLFKIFGVGLIPLRLLSFISSLGVFIIIYLFVKREAGDKLPGILAACLFAATYFLTVAHFDIGRVDSLFLFLLIASLYLIRFHESKKMYVLAGVLISLSFYTKQTALVVSLPVMLYCVLSQRRLAVYFIAPVITMVGIGSLLLNYYYDGWFNFYVYDLPRTTPVYTNVIFSFWIKDVMMPLGIASALGIVYLLFRFSEDNKKIFLFYFLAALGAFVASWYSRYRVGDQNVMFPAYAILSILFGLGFHRVSEIIDANSAYKKNLLLVLLYIVCMAQFSSESLVYNPFKLIPTDKDLQAGKELVKKISTIDGEVLIYNHGYLSYLAGKRTFANQMGMRDIIFTKSNKHDDVKSALYEDFRKAFMEKKFGAILVDTVETCNVPGTEEFYTMKEKLFADDKVFIPVRGTPTKPGFIYVPKDNSASE